MGYSMASLFPREGEELLSLPFLRQNFFLSFYLEDVFLREGLEIFTIILIVNDCYNMVFS